MSEETKATTEKQPTVEELTKAVASLQALIEKTAFYTRAVDQASKSEKKAIAGERIITNDNEEVVRLGDPLKEDLLELASSAQTKPRRILKGKIVGLKPIDFPERKVFAAVVQFGHGLVEVLIPDFHLYVFDLTKVKDEAYMNKQENVMRSMIGSDIEFVVTNLSESERVAFGNRLDAMQQIGYANYVRQLASTKKPRVQIGDIVQGTITSVARGYVRVEALGAEGVITQDVREGKCEVDWSRCTNLRTKYKVGQRVPVKLLNYNVAPAKINKEEYNLVIPQFSMKQCMPNPQEEYFDRYRVGQYVQVEITFIPTDLKQMFGVIQGVGNLDILIDKPSRGTLPSVGDIKMVRISGMSETLPDGSTTEKDGSPVKRIFGTYAEFD